MAKIKLDADTKGAQQAILKTKADLDKLRKDAEKPVQVGKGTGRRQYTRSSYQAPQASAVSKAAALGGVVGSAAGAMGSAALSAVIQFAPALTRLTTGVEGFGAELKNLIQALEVYGAPNTAALSRGAVLDALDDSRRQHGTSSLAEEFAWQEAIKNAWGVNADSTLAAVQARAARAKGGDLNATRIFQTLGISQDELQKLNAYELTARAIEAATGRPTAERKAEQLELLAAAKVGAPDIQQRLAAATGRSWAEVASMSESDYLQAMNKPNVALEKAGVELFENEGWGRALKAADAMADTYAARDKYMALWQKYMPNEAQVLANTSAAEHLQTQARIVDLAVPEGQEHRIIKGAEEELSGAQLRYSALGDDAGAILKESFNQARDKITSMEMLHLLRGINSNTAKAAEKQPATYE